MFAICPPNRWGCCLFIYLFYNYSKKLWVYLINSNDEAFAAFKKFPAFVTTQTGRKLKCLCINNGGDCTSAEFNRFCEDHGIKRELPFPYNPSSNGVAERYNRTLCERVRCMLSTTNLPHGFWGEALNNSIHVCNKSPHMSLNGGIF